jgi:poly(3-hydroxybutyrate) depolymerase
MKRFVVFLALLCLLPVPGKSQTSVLSKFMFRSFTDENGTLPYRLFVPDSFAGGSRYPLILALHGSGERGTDNTSPLTANRMGVAWAEPGPQSQHPCFVVVPQCPTDAVWSPIPMQDCLLHLLDSLGREFRLDSDKIYLTGLSMGGYGTWDLAARVPHRFAAVVPMSSGVNLALVDSLRTLPVWNFHGAKDDVVPVAQSRASMDALAAFGREVIYTHCRGNDCTGLPDSVVTMEVKSHADVFYTEYQNGGHIIWDAAYDYAPLHDWLFDKSRLHAGAIKLANFANYRRISGPETISWSGGGPADSVEIWFSSDYGGSWNALTQSAENTGGYGWNTAAFPDCAFGVIKIFLRTSGGHITGYDRSHYFAVANGVPGTPFVKLLKPELINATQVTADSLTFSCLAGDADADSLLLTAGYSRDGGATFLDIAAVRIPADTLPFTMTVPLTQLPNSETAVGRVTVSDGSGTYSDRTHLFSKKNPRIAGLPAGHISGGGGGAVTINVCDPALLTGHQYRVAFSAPPLGTKSYSVVDRTTGVTIVDGATDMNGTTEGPAFDGIRLLVNDVAIPAIDKQASRWTTAAPNVVPVSPSLPTLTIKGKKVPGLAYPSSYRMSISDHVIDTSQTAYSIFTATPVPFSVWNVTEGRKAAFGFYDKDGNGTLSNFDDIYLLEPDTTGSLHLSWSLLLAGTDTTTPPQPGDVYELRILTPFTAKDTFEFAGGISSVVGRREPERFELMQNYPNPFNGETKMSLVIGRSSLVSLRIYDILGRETAILLNEQMEAGEHTIRWDAAGISSGVYFCRMTTGGFTAVNKMILIK